MGFGGISIWQLLIVLGICVLLFGSKKLRSLGKDAGGAIRDFKRELAPVDQPDKISQVNHQHSEAETNTQP